MKMKLNLYTLFGGIPATCLLFHSQSRVFVIADCLVEGDMMFMEGQSIGQIGLECLNSTSYDALDKVCGPDGAVVESDAVYTCPDTNPNCVQCGERGVGAALCLDTTEVPSNCNGNATTTPPASSPASQERGCLVGDIMYQSGQSTGHIGLECLNSTSYDATESVCGSDGTMVESKAVYTCPETSSYCVQCGVAGVIGSALCLDSPEVPSDCNGNSTAEDTNTAPTPAAPTTTESPPSSSSSAANTPTTSTASHCSVEKIASMAIIFASSAFVYSWLSL